MKRIISIMLCALLLLTVMPFAFAEGGENVLTIAMGTKPCLDLHWNAGSTGASLMNMLYEGLYKITENSIELAGATSRDVSEDGMTLTYHLREDALWSDGKPVTAADYVYSMKRLVDPEVSSVYMLDYGQYLLNGSAISNGEKPLDELGVTAIDDYTLEIKLEKPCSYFETMLTYTSFFPLREDCVTFEGEADVRESNWRWAWNAEKHITNGHFILTYCDEEQEIILEKNPYYYGKDEVALDKLDVKLADDANTVLQLFETGAVDLIDSFPSEETERLKAAGYYHSVPSLYTRFLLVNNNAEGLSDPRVRKALSLVIDREFLADGILGGSFIAADSYVGAGFPGATEAADYHTDGGPLFSTTCTDEDIAQAQALMAEAGYPNGEGFPLLTCSYASSPNYDLLFQYLSEIWQENLGITVKLDPMEGAAMTELRDAGKFLITPQGWGPDWLDASNMLSIFVTGNFINAGRYSSEAFDKAYADAMYNYNTEERLNLLHEAEKQLVVEDMGIIPLYHRHAIALYRDSDLSNVKFDADRKVMWADIIVNK
ncbi:MAG: peptide ABC transporter substrate-binding protein [Clostridia bacterium]|nr:peptide ABC transporter substrate-binding protein [Clostridia bacterium]